MHSQELTDKAKRRQAVEKAKSILRANLSADFKDLVPHLQSLLENLPILQSDAPVLQAYPASKAAQSNTEGVIKYLKNEWIISKVTDYESIGPASIANEAELLSIVFSGNIWSVGYMEKQITVARVADDLFQCWHYYESGGIWGTAPGQYEMPRLGTTASKVRPHIRTTVEERSGASLSGLWAQVREWLRRLRRRR